MSYGIKCDRCGAEFDANGNEIISGEDENTVYDKKEYGGTCDVCGDNLCTSCAGDWQGDEGICAKCADDPMIAQLYGLCG